MQTIMSIARQTAGEREKFAIKYGNKSVIYIRNHKCYRFTYSRYLPYQDANGATFETVTQTWID